MKRIRALPLWLSFILLAALSGFLYFRAEAIGLDIPLGVMPSLRELKRLNAEWDAGILKSRIGLQSSYDAVTLSMRQIRELRERVRTEAHAEKGGPLAIALKDLDAVFTEKEELVEQFKSQNALLHNSLRYFPTATEEFTALLQWQQPSNLAQPATLKLLENRINVLLTDILRFNLRPENEPAEKLSASIAAIEAGWDTYPKAVLPELALLIRHAHIILQQRVDDDVLMNRIAMLPAAQTIDRLSSGIDQQINDMLQEKQRYRTYLFIYSGFLLVLLMYLAWRLLHSYKVIARVNRRLRSVNETLERRVAERTAELERQSAQLEQLATHDTLTGLINRRHLMTELTHALHRAERRSAVVALMFIDLDGFKEVNDRYGHAAGDAVLKEVAQRMQRHVRKEDAVARLGGDEFVILLNDANPSGTERIADALLDELRSLTVVNGHPVNVSASIGVSSVRVTHGAELMAETLLSQADHAMYQAKQHGKDCYRVSSPASRAVAC